MDVTLVWICLCSWKAWWALLVSTSLTLLQILDFLINIRRIAFVFDDLILNQLKLVEKLTELSASFSHYIKQIFSNNTLISHSSIPNYASDFLGNSFSPQFSYSCCWLKIVPVCKNLLLPYFCEPFFFLNLLLNLLFLLLLLFLLFLGILPSVFFHQLVGSLLFFFCFWWEIEWAVIHWFDALWNFGGSFADGDEFEEITPFLGKHVSNSSWDRSEIRIGGTK